MKECRFLKEMQPFWFGGHEDYDKLCQAFGPAIRDCGAGVLPKDPWEVTVEGQMAQLILCDQLSRNAFRGTDEAFAFDASALKAARTLSDAFCTTHENDEVQLEGQFFPAFSAMLLTCYMHSEEPKDHATGVSVLEWAKQETDESMRELWDNQGSYLLDHKAVVDRFGRYPHRNAKLGRTSTPEEQAWLDDRDNLPGWALSQL